MGKDRHLVFGDNMLEEIIMEQENMIVEIKQSETPSLGVPTLTIFSKPTTTLYVCIVLGVLMILSGKLFVLGICVLPLAAIGLWKIPNEKRVEFYENCLVLYQPKEKEMCEKIDYDSISEWYIKQGINTGDFFQMKLMSNQIVQVECFNSGKIVKHLNKIMPDKEANKKKVDNIKPTPINLSNFKFPWGKK